MKAKTLRIAWMILVLVWGISFFTGAQTDVYVAPAGGTSGIGTPTAPVALRANLLNTLTGTVSVYFAPGTYNQSAAITVPAGVTNLKFERTDPAAANPIIIGTAINSGRCIDISGRPANTTITIEHLTFRGFKGTGDNGILFSLGDAGANAATGITLDHVIIEGCSVTGGSNASLLAIRGNTATNKRFTFTHSTIRGCSAPALIRAYGDGTADNNRNSPLTVEISYNSIYGNTASAYIIYMYAGGGAGGVTIYNNTFSNNTGAGVIMFGAPNLKVANNTFYKSGQVTMTNMATGAQTGTFVNNIFIATPDSAFTNTTYPLTASHNIFSAASGAINYCTTGTTMTTNLTSDFGKIFDVSLDTDDPGPGRQYHRLINMDKGIWNIGCGEPVSLYGLNFTDDQVEVTRQTPFTLGSCDRHLILDPIPAQVFINPGITAPRTIDLSQYITNLPGGSAPVTYAPVLQSPPSSSSMSINGSLATIIPGANNDTCYFEYRVTQGSCSAVGRIYVRVYNFTGIQHLYGMPGIVNPAPYSCFDYMGAVQFTSAYRFRTGHTNRDQNRIAWSSTPLVADLDHDGYPEIIAVCIGADNTAATNSHGGWTGISIYDGRTGTRISRLPFMNGTQAMRFNHRGWHSATPFSLVDSDRDGVIEMIIAFTDRGDNNTAYRNRLVSYKMVPSINAQTGKTAAYTLVENPKWSTTGAAGFPQYNTGNEDYYHKAIPQICDFDGDGAPEVLVYNKIYSAVDGSLKLTMEGIGTNSGNATAYMGLNRNAPNGDDSGDKTLPFSCIYDMDGDGVYDVAAGGKIYKMNVVNSVFSAPAIIEPAGGGAAATGDGYTAVADIDGDGLPDVVVVNTVSSDNIAINVWNPTKGLFATRTVTVTGRTWGSNSYVFVGDIDGRVQIGPDGKEYRLPEIAVLSGRVALNTTSFPLHPNVASIPTGDDRNFGTGNYGGLPTSGTAGSSGNGCLFALTCDLTASAPGDRLKGSFVLEHADNSNDTGFTMFDFDNDGIQEICYRDMRYLRIIKPVFPYIKLAYVNTGSSTATDNHPEAILLRQDCGSTTGFEYPVIADVDNDGSAEIVLPGCDATGNDYYSFLYVIGNGNGDKFAPAWPVWNQYMYDPFKINPDLTTPVGPAKNRLKYKFTHEVKNEQGKVIKSITGYNPFNGNLKQVTKIDSSQVPDYEPVVFLTEAYIEPDTTAKGPKIRGAGTGNTAPYYIELTIGNRATAQTDISSNTPVAVYRNNSITHANRTTYRLSDLYAPGTGTATALGTGFTIKAGEDTTVWIPVGSTAADGNNIYIVRLGDDSDASDWRFGYNGGKSGTTFPCTGFNRGTGLASRAFRDCEWCDQTVRAARYRLFDDFYTVQAYNEVPVNILTNDILPNNSANRFFPNLVLSEANINTPPGAGTLTFNGRPGANNRVTYRHEGQPNPLFAHIDSFEYRLTFFDESLNRDVTKYAWVYIYIMNSTGGFAACYGAVANIELQNRPEGVSFEWYEDQSSASPVQTGRTYTTGPIFADSIYWLKPVMTNISTAAGNGVATARLNHYKTFDFPRGKLTVSPVTSAPGATALMRWTGLVSTEWQNPDNWVAVKTGANGKPYETPVTFAPMECANVIIPSNADFYPELVDTARCAGILMKDRAMLKNPHVLKYNHASVEIRLKPSERGRYIMWSAPLRNMYSGDYHYRKSTLSTPMPIPYWGDVYMNYFQQANPDGGSAVANHFTASFGSLNQALDLGRAFNLKVADNSVTRDSLLRFPRTESVYDYTNANGLPATANVPRNPDSLKFITHGKEPDANGLFDLPVFGGEAGNNLIQVVNPYMAWLRISDFLANTPGNTNFANFQGGYYIWNGEFNSAFHVVSVSGNRFGFAGPVATKDLDLIPPLQSFFIAKTASANITTVKMSPQWTTTSHASSYSLRASTMVTNGGMLNITLSQGDKKAYAALLYTPGSSPFISKEDMPVLVYKENPLTLYTLSMNQPLAINSNGQFDMAPVPLGFRATDAGETKLEFKNMETFGYDVVLVDKVLNKQTDLKKTPEYTFTIVKNGGGAVETNDRFSLLMNYTGKGVTTGNEAVQSSTLQVSGGTGYIYLRSEAGAIGNLQVFNAAGQLVYNTANLNESQFRLPVNGKQVYLVKAITGSELIVEKVFVK